MNNISVIVKSLKMKWKEESTLCYRGAMGKFKKFKLKWATKIVILCTRGHRSFYSFSIGALNNILTKVEYPPAPCSRYFMTGPLDIKMLVG